eukprot:3349983-Pyramimonas_sp.AAC.1
MPCAIQRQSHIRTPYIGARTCPERVSTWRDVGPARPALRGQRGGGRGPQKTCCEQKSERWMLETL